MIYVEARKRLVDWLRRQLVGPAQEGSLSMSPLERYPTGVLHPIEPGASGIDPASAGHAPDAGPALLEDEEEEDETPADDESAAQPLVQPVRRRRYVPPSSVGFSCCVRGEVRLSITASAAIYKDAGERGERGQFQSHRYERAELEEHSLTWTGFEAPREPIQERRADADVRTLPRSPDAATTFIWDGLAGIDIRARPHRDSTILTVTLFNRRELDGHLIGRRRIVDRVEKSLFEARLECAIEAGELVEYPRVDPSLLSQEEQELELQYRDRRIYAVGHGAAVDWDVAPGRTPCIRSEFMPETEVPMMTVDTGGDDGLLELRRLSSTPMHDALARFITGYANWIDGQRRIAAAIENTRERAAAQRICGRMEVALGRMERCVAMLRSDPLAAESFQLANRAMFEQMRQADRVAGRETEAGGYRWRPFQLAFLLTVVESAIREGDDFRDVLDLIWFPTGGGKTEAYLGLIAFLIVWRRLKYPDTGGGTAAFMRYTLRLLTRQQFERAARMTCALESMRRANPARLGEEPIDIGIWVGEAISPNRFDQALKLVGGVAAGGQRAHHALLLEGCPWCHTPFDARHGYRATESDFRFHCVNRECEFGADDRPLPCNVVDEALYKNPPSLLVGTIDKFARVAWDERAGVFFGAGRRSRPPELVIQDELHLVTGPLGSVAGLYEAGFDTLLTRRGVRPKYIASTATIRMAGEQVRRLYARDLAVFPPPGLSCDDSYFARTDKKRPGRLYVGYLAPMLDQQHCLAPLAAALLAAPLTIFGDDADRDELLDAWWTQVIYHGSLKGVGNSHNAFFTDVRDFGHRLVKEHLEAGRSGRADTSSASVGEPQGDVDDALGGAGLADEPGDASAREPNGVSERFQHLSPVQLTSMRSAQENAATFQRLAKRRQDGECLDAVLATNMMSVGLDVARLALMVVNGQPLTTAEYIQATSRVGRAQVPGLVFANYYRHQARSLSHYESFRPYHESFYRFVEPSSVTPYTHQVRSRALHAALVIALRHACDHLRGNKSAGAFDRHSPQVKAVIAELKRRCRRAATGPGRACDTDSPIDGMAEGAVGRPDEPGQARDRRSWFVAQSEGEVTEPDQPGQAHGTDAHIDRLVQEWHDEARRCQEAKRQLRYQAPDRERNADRLLYDYGELRGGLWRTLRSMRNVESTATLKPHG